MKTQQQTVGRTMTTARVLSHRLSCLCPQERPAEWGSGAWPSEKQQKAQLKFIYVHSRGEKQRPKLDPKTLRLKKKSWARWDAHVVPMFQRCRKVKPGLKGSQSSLCAGLQSLERKKQGGASEDFSPKVILWPLHMNAHM